MNRLKDTYKHMVAVASALLLALSVLPACSDDEGGGVIEEEQLYKLTIALNTSTSYTPVTKADQPGWADEANVYERRIEKCWVVLFDAAGTCVASVNANDIIDNSTDVDNEQLVRQTTVELPAGNYMGYAFANLNNLTEDSKDIITLLEGDLAGITKDALNTTVSLIDAKSFTLAEGGKSIPMSSYETNITVQANTENTARIVLFRMIGKVEISITDQTNDKGTKTLKSLSMGNFRTGPIHLLPYSYGETTLNDITPKDQNLLRPQFPENVKSTPYTHKVVENGDDEISEDPDNPSIYTFYAFETGTESNTNALSVTVGVGDRTPSVKPTDFSFMRRNDWLKIPIVLTNIESYIRFTNMRMPIGGLPKEIVYGEGDGYHILVDAEMDVNADYAGPIKIEVEIKSINNGAITPTILYTNTTTEGSAGRSTAILAENKSDLLIDKKTSEPIKQGHDFTVLPLPGEESNTKKAYFEVWTQELAKEAVAIIKLTLIAEYDDTDTGPKKRIEIPYTIRIQNYKTQGGN